MNERGEFMEVNKIFSKLNMKNYNNELEGILEEKLFSLDVKNLLLSMLYKIENGYKDYEVVKKEVLPQGEFISYIIKIIKEKCFDIEFISQEKGAIPNVNKNTGKILCYPNEKSLLSSIWYMGEKRFSIPVKYAYMEEEIKKVILIGNNMNQVEVIRDFNGWSWDIVIKEIENIQYNILYQSLLLLEGEELLYASMEVKENNDSLAQKRQKEFSDFLEMFSCVVMNINMEENKDMLHRMEKIKEEKTKQLELLQNKKEFVQQKTNEKKECSIKIEAIDKIINNTDLLKKEYQERNRALPNKEKIFSISHLVDRLENERKELLENIKQCNQMIEPKEFVKIKEEIEKEVEFLTAKRNTIDCCRAFLRCAKMKIENLEEKIDIIQWIYKIRYYYQIPFNDDIYLKDIEELKEDFKEVIQQLIQKAQTYKIWDMFTEDQELAYIVIQELFNSKMINFENVNILCQYENGILHLEYYDGNILEKKSQFELENVRIKKKIKLFI